MTCIRCRHEACKRFGTYGRRKIQRWRCQECKATFSTPQPKIGTHYTDLDTAGKILTLMLEGMSIRAIERFIGVHRDTILRIMQTAGAKARQLLDSKIQNITPRFVQVDEMWTYVHTREPNLRDSDSPEWGSIYLWLALDSETKLILTNHLGSRNGVNAHRFMFDLRNRTVGKYQITSDAFKPYLGAVREWFGSDTNYGVLRKIYGKVSMDNWYGSGQVLGAVAYVKIGKPDYSRISTSHVERANLSVRMHLRRYTRLTNAASKSLENLKDAVSLYIAFYNFVRVHQALKATPAMAAGLTDHPWTMAELLGATQN